LINHFKPYQEELWSSRKAAGHPASSIELAMAEDLGQHVQQPPSWRSSLLGDPGVKFFYGKLGE
jgi:hypothetical protein